AVLQRAFKGTAQPVPGSGGVTVWYMEDGFQSKPETSRLLYSGYETDPAPVSENVQGAQIAAAVRLAYCQPAVGAFFNFELRDEPSLAGWQSGLLRPDWSPKPAFSSYKYVIAEARARSITCTRQNGAAATGGRGSHRNDTSAKRVVHPLWRQPR